MWKFNTESALQAKENLSGIFFINKTERPIAVCHTKILTKLLFVISRTKINKGNAKRAVSPCLKIWPNDLDLWPWKSLRFQILLRTKYIPSLVKIHWRMLILECSQGCYSVKFDSVTLKINRVPDSPKDLSMYQVWSKSIEGCWF